MGEVASDVRAGLWDRPHVRFLAIAFAWSWSLWIGSWIVARVGGGADQLVNEDLVWGLFFDGGVSSTVVWLSLLSLMAVYGPMVAGVLATRLDQAVSSRGLWASVRRTRVGGRWYGLVLGILALVAGPAAIIVAVTAQPAPDAPGAETLLVFLAVFFVFQLLTSGTEEIGWRGYLNEKLRHGRNFWDTGWAVGIPWAIWHWPIVVIMFVQQGMTVVVILSSLAGFSIGIVAASILHAWFYERTRSVFLNIFIHATFNTIPLTTTLLFRDSPAAVIANLALWAVVIVLKRQHDESDATDAAQPSVTASPRR